MSSEKRASNTEEEKGIFIKAPIYYTDDYVKLTQKHLFRENDNNQKSTLQEFICLTINIVKFSNVMESGLEITPWLFSTLSDKRMGRILKLIVGLIRRVAKKGEVSNIIGNSSAYNSRKYIADTCNC